MSTVLVAGLGEVGVRTARQLIDTPGVDRVIVAARRLEHARDISAALHDGAEPLQLGRDDPLPPDVDAIVSALPSDVDPALARRAVAAGIPYASCADRDASLRALLALDTDARAHGVRVVVGLRAGPGLTDVLARHAVGALDAVDELHVARWGSRARSRRAKRGGRTATTRQEWRDGALVARQAPARPADLVSRPGRRARVRARRHGGRAARGGDAGRGQGHGPPGDRRRRTGSRPPGRRDPGAAWGAVRVEAWGWRGPARTSVVYGVIERTAIAAGTVLGVTAAWLAGALPDLAPVGDPGAAGLGAVIDPVAFLAELARRGVKAAAFEGVAVG